MEMVIHIFFSNAGDAPLNQEQEKEWEEIENSRFMLKQSMDKLVSIIRIKYIEINIKLIGDEGIKEYLKVKAEMSVDV